MERIESHNKDSKELAKQVLTWIAHAMRPLKASELQCALAVEIGTPAFDEENIPDLHRMISVCAGLVITEDESKTMRLVHYTAQEYFEDHPQALSSNCHNDILEVCVTYLSYDIFETGPCESAILFSARLESYALYEYASQDWAHHAYKSSVRATPLVMGLLQNQKKLDACYQAHTRNFGQWDECKRRYFKDKMITGLSFAACFGLEGPVAALLSAGADTESRVYRDGATPLSGAVIHGHGTVVKLLLENGANIEAKAYSNETPLHLAVKYKREAIVGLLVNSGADIEAKNGLRKTPLASAANAGNKSMASLLIENGADIEAKDYGGSTPLLFAAASGSVETVELLIDKGANIGVKSRIGHSLLSVAAMWGNAAVIKLLLNCGADINANDGGMTPLSTAIMRENPVVVDLLLKNGADIDARDIQEMTPLLSAVANGRIDMVELLLMNGANIEARDSQARTPLLFAVLKAAYRPGVEDHLIIELLLSRGANPEVEDNEHKTPRSVALEHKRGKIVELLDKFSTAIRESRLGSASYSSFRIGQSSISELDERIKFQKGKKPMHIQY
ncbi:hypothetical protein TWF679_000222 [Orbilia oligospora]|uniref:GPI inositol-deacylase winged helix domain-containing protein n=1 Tax=Orbilia oligospora TaxID=2813651 RepID=A0A8H8VNE6_ORBOL|nr:hypothetical protein TWF679_000222 [Orbilia oligospora]